jgi:alkylhydroperoxidase family enzyme
MGHSEMKLAVAGLDKKAVAKRVQTLASGDWSRFRPAEEAAFSFASKQAKTPSSITAKELQALIHHFGRERAIDLIWWASSCNYMTRVASAFQLPLEKENVFDGFIP